MDPLQLFCSSAFFGLLGLHLWSRRHCCRHLQAWAQTFPWPEEAERGEGASSVDRWAEKQMDEFRVQSAQMLCEALSILLAISMFFVFTGLSSVAGTGQKAIFALASCLYPLSLLGRHDGPIKITSFGASCIYLIMHAMMIGLCHISVPGDAYVYYAGGMRTLVRFCSAFMVLDVRLSSAVNGAWSAVLIYQHLFDMPAELRGFCFVDWLALEVMTFLGMQAFLSFAETFLRAHFRLNTSMALATNLQQAVRQLLSVLCDAELQLSPGLEILSPSQRAAQLLSPGSSPAELSGSPFQDFVVPADRERFKGFLSLAAGSAAPASLQLQLQDGTGFPFSAEIFLARLPDLVEEQPSHLIGIKDCGVAREASAAAEAKGPTFGPGCPPPPMPTVRARERQEDETTSASTALLRALELPELSMEVRFDPLEKDLPVQELRCSFKGGGKGLQQPLLTTWFHEAFRRRLLDWVQENCNSFAVGEAADYTDFGGSAVLQLPPRGDPTLLETARMAIKFLLGDEESSEREASGDEESREESEEGEAMVGVIEMAAFTQLYTAKGPGRSRGSRSKGERSRKSARSRRSETAEPLQSITEVEAAQ